MLLTYTECCDRSHNYQHRTSVVTIILATTNSITSVSIIATDPLSFLRGLKTVIESTRRIAPQENTLIARKAGQESDRREWSLPSPSVPGLHWLWARPQPSGLLRGCQSPRSHILFTHTPRPCKKRKTKYMSLCCSGYYGAKPACVCGKSKPEFCFQRRINQINVSKSSQVTYLMKAAISPPLNVFFF